MLGVTRPAWANAIMGGGYQDRYAPAVTAITKSTIFAENAIFVIPITSRGKKAGQYAKRKGGRNPSTGR